MQEGPHAWSETLQIVLRRGLDLRERGNLGEACECFERCLDLSRTIPDPLLEARALACLGTIAMTQGRTEEARERFGQALSIRAEAGDLLGQARSLNDLALCDLRLGRSDEALTRLRESLSRTAGAEPGRTRAETLEHLGRVHRDRGDLKEALRMFKDALEIRRELEDRTGIASNLNAIGMVYHLLAQPEEAFDHLRRAYELRRSLEDRRAIAVTANNLALVHYGQGHLEEAEALLAEALTGFRAAGDLSGVAHAHSNLGLVFNEQGRMVQAREHHSESLKIREDLKDLSGQANSLNNLSHLALERGRAGEALAFAERSLDLRRRAGMTGATAKPLFNIGCALLDLGEIVRAREAAEEVVRIARESGSIESEGEGLLLRTEVDLAADRTGGPAPEAAEEIARALSLAEKTKDPRLTAYALRVRAEILLLDGRRDEGRDTLTRAERLLRGKAPAGELARIHRAQGVLASSAGATQSAIERLQRAAREFGEIGNASDRARTLAILARVVHPQSPREAGRLWEEAEAAAAAIEGRDRPLDLGMPPGLDAQRAGETAETAPLEPLVELIEPLAEADSPARTGLFLARLRARLRADAAGLVSGPIPVRTGDAEAIPLPDGRILWTPPGQDPDASRLLSTDGGDGDLRRWTEPIEGTDGSCWIGVLGPKAPEEERSLLRLLALLVGRFRLAGIDPVGSAAPKRVDEAFEGLVGSAPSMLGLYDTIERVSQSDVSVLILGESGTGKELVARAMHARSARASGPFVPINCPSIPRELIEAELFGHEKGAYTGATTARPGKVELADRGTLFLDEIGDMDQATQSKLLRFLQEREFQRVGGRQTHHVDVRVLAATSRDLRQAMESGAFRADLFYRLSVVPLTLPPLRDRKEDIPALARHFLREIESEAKRKLSITPRAIEILRAHSWPGNVRELRNALAHMAAMAEGSVLDTSQMPASIPRGAPGGAPAQREPGTGGAPGTAAPLRSGETLQDRLVEVEARVIRWGLEVEGWNQSAAARRLGITETMVRNRMRRFSIEKPDLEGGSGEGGSR